MQKGYDARNARLGASWFPAVRLTLECAALAGTGWVIGRLNRSGPVVAALIFAATLEPWDFGEMLESGGPEQIKRSPKVQEIYLGTA